MPNSTRSSEWDLSALPTYRIRVAGVLGEEWSGRAQGMAISVDRSEPGRSSTELLGVLPDEAALMGVLNALYNHGARLLIVERIDERGTTIVENGDQGNREGLP